MHKEDRRRMEALGYIAELVKAYTEAARHNGKPVIAEIAREMVEDAVGRNIGGRLDTKFFLMLTMNGLAKRTAALVVHDENPPKNQTELRFFLVFPPPLSITLGESTTIWWIDEFNEDTYQ